MIFTSVEYILFFLGVMVVRSLLTNFAAEKYFLLVASYLFYMSWNPRYGLLLLGTSLFDYWVGSRLGVVRHAQARRLLISLSLASNLGVLAFFKYANFFIDNAHRVLSSLGVHTSPRALDIVLPIGISFFTFQSISYTMDIYRGVLKPSRRLSDFLLFVAFFPQLIAGPIVRARDLLPQITRRVRAKVVEFESGLVLFALGAAKKLVISDQISRHVDVLFAAPANYSALSLLLGVVGFGVQIYCDFSGYSDMAIGCARMMGYDFGENFRMPYASLNITEFWHRWHISLSTWLRDYLYISLGGNRHGMNRTYLNLMVTMLLGGLWHGASWTFVVWGGLHGLALVVHKLWSGFKKSRQIRWSSQFGSAIGKVTGWVLTSSIVMIGWVFFRAKSFGAAWTILKRIITWDSGGIPFLSPQIIAAIAVVALVHCAVDKDRDWSQLVVMRPAYQRVVLYASLLLGILSFGAVESAPFIYFQF